MTYAPSSFPSGEYKGAPKELYKVESFSGRRGQRNKERGDCFRQDHLPMGTEEVYQVDYLSVLTR